MPRGILSLFSIKTTNTEFDGMCMKSLGKNKQRQAFFRIIEPVVPLVSESQQLSCYLRRRTQSNTRNRVNLRKTNVLKTIPKETFN